MRNVARNRSMPNDLISTVPTRRAHIQIELISIRLVGTNKRPRVYECYLGAFRGGNPLERVVGILEMRSVRVDPG